MGIFVRLLSRDQPTALDEIKQCIIVQEHVGWAPEVVPSHVYRVDSLGLLTQIVDLGYVLVAFLGDNSEEVIGFARITFTSDSSKHWLHEVAVDPSVQSKGVGFALMSRIAEISRTIGAARILFTYDPFDARNGRLYLNKCGGRGAWAVGL